MAASDPTEPQDERTAAGERHALIYGDVKLVYDVVRMERPAGKISINVEPDGTVQVQVGFQASTAAIQKAVQSRARWIADRVSEAEERLRNVLEREYVSGEEVFYVGRRYQLKLIDAPRSQRRTRLYRGRLEMFTETRDPLVIRARLRAWHKVRAQQILSQGIRTISAKLPWIDTTPRFELVEMQKRWGSCSTDGTVRLHPFLVRAPRDCIEHVILHELCHLKEHNHSAQFYQLLNRAMPDWEKVKANLDGMSELYLNT